MAAIGTLVEGVDFVTLSSRDFERAVEFYGTTLGLPESARYGQMPGVELETGSLTLAIIESSAFGLEFAPHTHPVALHVADVAAARAELEARGVRFAAATIDTDGALLFGMSEQKRPRPAVPTRTAATRAR